MKVAGTAIRANYDLDGGEREAEKGSIRRVSWTEKSYCALVGGKNLNPECTIRGNTTENA